MRITHVITGMAGGGAESALHKLISATRTHGVSHSVVALTARYTDGIRNEFGDRLRGEGIPVVSLGMRQGIPDPRALVRLVRLLRRERPDVVQTWLYHADLLGGLAARWVGIPVIWGVRHGRLDGRDKLLTRATRRACAVLSRWIPAAIVCNSELARQVHADAGYAADKLVVIPNGFEVTRFRPDAEARRALRAELGIAQDAPLVGLVARFHPHKDHGLFLATAARVREAVPRARFLLCGQGVDWDNATLVAAIDGLRLRPAVALLGKRDDVQRVMASLDVACLTSVTESFPNVIGEAMACGVPCVATTCGDVADIVGETGAVVAGRDPQAIADAIAGILRLPAPARERLGAAARARVMDTFAIDVVAARFTELQGAAARPRRAWALDGERR